MIDYDRGSWYGIHLLRLARLGTTFGASRRDVGEPLLRWARACIAGGVELAEAYYEL